MKKIFVFFLSAYTLLAFGQEQRPALKMLDQQDYLTWKTIRDVQISADGLYSSYRVVPGEGDPVLNIYDAARKSTVSIPRVSKSQFDYDADMYLALSLHPGTAYVALERKKVDKKKWPCDTLFIYQPEKGIDGKNPLRHRICCTNKI
jgi:hypothetical protein